MKKISKATKVMNLLNSAKGLTDKQIALKAKCHPNYVWMIRKKMAHVDPCPEEVLELTPAMEVPKPGEYIVVEEARNAQEIDAILNARASQYGAFISVAAASQQLKGVMHAWLRTNGKNLKADQNEALDMIASKIARIVNGDAEYVDSWVDIAGYAQLVADRLQGKER